MMTVKQLLRAEGRHWARLPSKELSSVETLLWSACSDLADLVEMTIEPEDLPHTWQGTWITLWGAEAYFKDVGHPLAQSHALVMLLVERASRGLSPRGDDTKPRLKSV